ncbi:MAG: PF20097 family protein [Candidatus Bathyarchaeota archaeon]
MENESDSFECPKCGRNMHKGYLVSSSGIRWSDRVTPRQMEGLSDLWRGLDRRTEPFPPLYPQQPFGIEAYRCRICGIVWIDENRLPSI